MNCKITSCKGKENCLQHCPCDCHKTEGEINKEKSIARQTLIEQQIYQKGFGDGHKEAREYMKKLIKDEIWTHHELYQGFLEEHKVGIKKAINELCMKSHNEVLEMLIKLL